MAYMPEGHCFPVSQFLNPSTSSTQFPSPQFSRLYRPCSPLTPQSTDHKTFSHQGPPQGSDFLAPASEVGIELGALLTKIITSRGI